MINDNFIYLGILLFSLGNLSYIFDTLSGKIKPNRVTYFFWAIAPLITFASQIKQGVGIQSLLALVVGFWPLLGFLASFVNKKAEWKLTKFDIICGILSFTGLILWLLTKIANLAIIFSIAADVMAAIPTIRKSFLYPKTESFWPYLSGAVYGVITLLTIKNWSFQYYAFPLYIIIVFSVLSCLIIFDFKIRFFK